MTGLGHVVAGFAAEALRSLTPSQVDFIRRLPKAELHAHLNGSIPISILRQLALEHVTEAAGTSEPGDSQQIQAGLERLQDGVEFNEIQDFFRLFPAIYALTSTPAALRRATSGVLCEFLDGENPQCAYLELRTTPRETPAMSRLEYMRAVLEEVERYPPHKAAVIISIDRKMEDAVAGECVSIARMLRGEGRRVVGVDLCGNPTVCSLAHIFRGHSSRRCLQGGNMNMFLRHLRDAKLAGLGVTIHIAEVHRYWTYSRKELTSLLICRLARIRRRKPCSSCPANPIAWDTPRFSMTRQRIWS